MQLLLKETYNTIVLCYRGPTQPPTLWYWSLCAILTALHLKKYKVWFRYQTVLYCTPQKSKFKHETEAKDRWARTKPISMVQCTEQIMFLYTILYLFCKSILWTCSKSVVQNWISSFELQLYIAQTRYIKYWSIRSVHTAPNMLPTKSK